MNYKILIIIVLSLIVVLLDSMSKETFGSETEKKGFQIEKAFIINLDKDIERIETIKKQLNEAHVKHERFPAVYGKTLSKKDPHYLKYISPKGKTTLSLAQIGCALSHIHIWEQVANQKDNKHFLILEDDAIVPKNINTLLNTRLTQLPESWDMLLLGGNTIRGVKYSKNWIKPKRKDKKHGNYGLFGYIINAKCAKKLLKMCLNMDKTIDHYLNINFYRKENVYIANPMIITHDYNYYSNIFERKRNDDEKRNNKIKII